MHIYIFLPIKRENYKRREHPSGTSKIPFSPSNTFYTGTKEGLFFLDHLGDGLEEGLIADPLWASKSRIAYGNTCLSKIDESVITALCHFIGDPRDGE